MLQSKYLDAVGCEVFVVISNELSALTIFYVMAFLFVSDSDGAEALASRVSSSTTPTAKLILLLLVPLSMGSIFSHTILIQR